VASQDRKRPRPIAAAPCRGTAGNEQTWSAPDCYNPTAPVPGSPHPRAQGRLQHAVCGESPANTTACGDKFDQKVVRKEILRTRSSRACSAKSFLSTRAWRPRIFASLLEPIRTVSGAICVCRLSATPSTNRSRGSRRCNPCSAKTRQSSATVTLLRRSSRTTRIFSSAEYCLRRGLRSDGVSGVLDLGQTLHASGGHDEPEILRSSGPKSGEASSLDCSGRGRRNAKRCGRRRVLWRFFSIEAPVERRFALRVSDRWIRPSSSES